MSHWRQTNQNGTPITKQGRNFMQESKTPDVVDSVAGAKYEEYSKQLGVYYHKYYSLQKDLEKVQLSMRDLADKMEILHIRLFGIESTTGLMREIVSTSKEEKEF